MTLELLQIYLVRHGETAWSLTGQHTGVTDLGLTANGERQARSLAPRLSQVDFALVLVSPRLRARQTCELAGLTPDTDIEVEPDLAEWDYGDYEGQRSADIHKDHPGWNVWSDGCPHGETPEAVSARADSVIAKLCTLSGKVALFSHGQFGAALAARWIGLPVVNGQHLALHPASLSILSHDRNYPHRRVIELWNENPAARLDDALAPTNTDTDAAHAAEQPRDTDRQAVVNAVDSMIQDQLSTGSEQAASMSGELR